MNIQITISKQLSQSVGSCNCCSYSWAGCEIPKYVYEIIFTSGNKFQSTSIRLCKIHRNELEKAIKESKA